MSNPIKSLKSEPKVKRIIHELNFDFEHPHWAFTSSSQGGAASGDNDFFLVKQNFTDELPSEEESSILKEIGEEFVAIEKSAVTNKNTPSTSADAEAVKAGDDTKNELGIKQNMSDNTDDKDVKIAELQKSLAIRDIKDDLSKYGLDAEVVKSLSEVLVGHEQTIKPIVESVIKSFQDKVADLTKAVKTSEPNELAKALSREEGYDASGTEKQNDGSLLTKAMAAATPKNGDSK